MENEELGAAGSALGAAVPSEKGSGRYTWANVAHLPWQVTPPSAGTMSVTMRELIAENEKLKDEVRAANQRADFLEEKLKSATAPDGVIHHSVSGLVSSLDPKLLADRKRPMLSFEQAATKMLGETDGKVRLSFSGNNGARHIIVGIVVTDTASGVALLLRKEVSDNLAILIAEDAVVHAMTERVIRKMEE